MMAALLQQSIWRVIDQSSLGTNFDGKQSFAIDDVLCESVGSGNSPATARLWTHDRTIILGIQDTRLPHLRHGLRVLQAAGYRCIVRNSGGLAVVLDPGVLNLSLIFSEKERPLSIDEAYQAMAVFIEKLLLNYHLKAETGEIVHSYCPGRYDLSCGGRKFAGISQRRAKKGVAVQIYLCVSGSGSERAELVRQFYQAGIGGEATVFTYPDIDPASMASLEELCEKKLTISQLSADILKLLQSFGTLNTAPLTEMESRAFGFYYERIIRRNEKVFDCPDD
ncbi:MAG: biotin/lipoate A/B protein ligase family protein [Sporolactobacillus sp.]